MSSKRRPVHHQDKDPWGWVVVGATFVATLITFGNLKALGVLLLAMQNDFDSDVWIIGWMAVLYNSVSYISGPFIAGIDRLVSSRRCVVIVGGVLGSAGFIIGSQSTTVLQLILSLVILSGAGKALSFFPFFGVLACYFSDNYSVAIAIASSSIPISMIVYGPLTQILLDTYGWRGTMLIMGGITSNLVVCGALLKTPAVASQTCTEQYQKVPDDAADGEDISTEGENIPSSKSHKGKCVTLKENIQRFLTSMDFEIMTNKRFLFMTASMSCVDFCFNGWIVYMVSHGIFQGLSSNQASLLPTSFGIGYILGKFMEPLFDHTRFKLSTCTWVYLGCVIMFASYLTEAFMTMFHVQMIVTCFIGMGHGIVSQSNDVIVRFLTSGDRIVAVVCWQALIGGVCGMGSGLLTGLTFEWTGSFQAALIMYSGIMLISIPLFIIYDIITRQEQDRVK
ncbi:monocarboxylate transporter 12-like [Asterias amurensis]|uniref:monocarboxylate transporter 12-like n=1 Tax=Asterias amurensis TaxID=7602 RepID=UPI003AB27DFD